MFVWPTATPVTIPLEEPTVAIPVLPLLHVPPVVASLNVVVAPVQADAAPVMDEGNALTDTSVVVLQPALVV